MSKEAERRCVENEDGLQIGAPSSPPSPYLHLVGECDSDEIKQAKQAPLFKRVKNFSTSRLWVSGVLLLPSEW